MVISNSRFLFKIVIENLNIFMQCKTAKVTVQFADVFKVYLKISNKLRTKNVKPKHKLLKSNLSIMKSEFKSQLHTSQSVLTKINIPELIFRMRNYPLEIFICKDNNLDQSIGSAIIPWSNEFIECLIRDIKHPSAHSNGQYNVYYELTLEQIGSIDMSLNLFDLKDKIINKSMAISNKLGAFVNVEKHKKNNNSSSAKYLSHKHNSLKTKSFTDIGLSKVGCIKCDTDAINKNNNFITEESCTPFITQKNKLYRYIFGDPKGLFGNKVYQVGYFTVKTGDINQSSPKHSSDIQSSEKSPDGKKTLTFKKCDSACLNMTNKNDNVSCTDNVFTLNLPKEVDGPTKITKCKELTCNYKEHRELPLPVDDRILLDSTSMKVDCCTEIKEKVQDVVDGVIAKMKVGRDPCFCTCECGLFNFTRKTTYCTVCKGYEIAGDDITHKTAHETPIPCPIFHKFVDKNKLKTWSTSGSESKKKGDDQKSLKGSSGQKVTVDKRQRFNENANVKSEKSKEKKKDDRFKFNYGYKAPHIGHSNCAAPCAGTLDNVPKRMGWLWSAENIPGLKFRPLWKPGAINKHVSRLLRMARHPGQMISRKKRKDTGKKKRPIKRPLLVVHKKDGEYAVTMETMKLYSKPRALNQNPYEDKPVVTYTIGRTEEENYERLKRKEREQRRLERDQRHFIQSAFKNMCHEICLKTYQQALGILPDSEDPECACYPALPSAKDTNMDLSCSCSEEKSVIVDSDTDSDEWFVEFTPPNATYDPTYKGKKIVKVDNGSQYTYLDYKIKLVDRFGNAIPRFFKGPNGRQECSDLGGFWSPGHKWLEINVDGFIAPDGRWAPMNFVGPSGEPVEAETGKFQTTNGKWLIVGVDGFVDIQGKWKFYAKSMKSIKKKHKAAEVRNKRSGDKMLDNTAYKTEAWSCFGDVSPRQLSELGIVGHGVDRKILLMKLQKMTQSGQDVRLPQQSTVFHLPTAKSVRKGRNVMTLSRGFQERSQCHHPVPSDKGVVAVDEYGNKTYFRLKNRQNRRPNERMATLSQRGISLSSFHVPCFHSFINSEIMKQQQRERIFAPSHKNQSLGTQLS